MGICVGVSLKGASILDVASHFRVAFSFFVLNGSSLLEYQQGLASEASPGICLGCVLQRGLPIPALIPALRPEESFLVGLGMGRKSCASHHIHCRGIVSKS